MGYKPNRTMYKLDFSETELAGLEITARGSTVSGLMELAGLAGDLDGLDTATAGDMKELMEKLRKMFAPFARVLDSWNVEDDDGAPVPATLDGLLSQELPFVKEVIEAYVSELAAAPPPLPGSSGSGATSPEASLGLAGASSSLPSSSAPT